VSTDQLSPPSLTAYREDGATVLGLIPLSLSGVVAPPARVVVKSSAGGEDSEPVQISGAAFPTVLMVAMAGPDQSVPQGAQVFLDGTSSTGDIATYLWEQTGGSTTVTLNNDNTAIANFTTLTAGDTYTFTLTVDDNPDVQQPASTDEVVVTVEAVTTPVANAGPDQGPSQVVVQGATINLDGSASTGATDYHWVQISGTPVTNLQGADHSLIASFVLTDDNPVEFQLDVTGPGGPASDTVLITPLQDALTVTSAKFTSSKNQWDIRGTATVFGDPDGPGNIVSIYRDAALTDLVGSADVKALGDWRLKDNVPGPGNQIYVVSNRGGGPISFNPRN